MKTVTASFVVDIEGDLLERSDEELKEFVYDLIATGGPNDFNWTIEEEED